MKYMVYTYILLTAFVLVSCVRDEILPCPPLQVNIAVKDKNYFNVDKVELEDRLSDNLPLRDYVPTLYYRLNRIMEDGTSRMVEEKGVFPVESDGKTYPVTFDGSLPHGTYVITVWGGLDKLDPLSEDRTSISFHPGHTEGLDVYMANDTLVYDAYNYAYTTEMERTKGKLIIQVTNLPTAVHYSDKTITGLYGEMDCCMFEYSKRTEVTTIREWQPGNEVVTKTVLTPSVKEKGSLLSVNFYDEAGRDKPVFSPEDVNITMRRNMLTVLKYVYDGNGGFTIYILVNDNWEKVHGLIVGE